MPTERTRGLGLAGTAALSAVVSAVVSLGGLSLYDRVYAQKIVAFDLPGYVDAVQKEVGRGTMSEDAMAASLAKVDRLLAGVAPNQVVLSRDVVLRNARELALPMIDLKASHDSRPPPSPSLETGRRRDSAVAPGADGRQLP